MAIRKIYRLTVAANEWPLWSAVPPDEELRDTVDLIVVLAVREECHLPPELRHPRSVSRDCDTSAFNPGRHAHQARGFIILWLPTDHIGIALPLEVLKKLHAGTRLLYDHAHCPVLLGFSNNLPLELRKLQLHPTQGQEPGMMSAHEPGRADRVVIRVFRPDRCIP